MARMPEICPRDCASLDADNMRYSCLAFRKVLQVTADDEHLKLPECVAACRAADAVKAAGPA